MSTSQHAPSTPLQRELERLLREYSPVLSTFAGHSRASETPPAISARARYTPCCVCGHVSRTTSQRVTRGVSHEARHPPNRTIVACAHVLRNHAAAATLGVTYDAWSNFLPLCGDMKVDKSCHGAFDNAKLAFSATETPGVYDVVTHPSYSYLRRRNVELPHASPRALEAHYAFCLLNGLVDPPPALLERNAAAKSSERPHPPPSAVAVAAAESLDAASEVSRTPLAPSGGADFVECLPAVDCQAAGCSDAAFVMALPKLVDADAGLHLTQASTGGADATTVPRAVLPRGSKMGLSAAADIERWAKAAVGPQACTSSAARYQLRLGVAKPSVVTTPDAGCVSTGVAEFAFLEALPHGLVSAGGAAAPKKGVGVLSVAIEFTDADGLRCELRFTDGGTSGGTASRLSWTTAADGARGHHAGEHDHHHHHQQTVLLLPSIAVDVCVRELPTAPVYAAKLPLGKASDAHWRRLLSAMLIGKSGGQYPALLAQVLRSVAAETGGRTPVLWASALSSLTSTLTAEAWSAMEHSDASERCWIGKVNRAEAAPLEVDLSADSASASLRACEITRESYVALSPEPSGTSAIAPSALELTLTRFIRSAAAALVPAAPAADQVAAPGAPLRMRLYNHHAEPSDDGSETPKPRFVAGRVLPNMPWHVQPPLHGSFVMCRRAGHDTAYPVRFPQRQPGRRAGQRTPRSHPLGVASPEHRLVLLRAELWETPGESTRCALHPILDGAVPPQTTPAIAAISSQQLTSGLSPLPQHTATAYRVVLHATSGAIPAVEVSVPATSPKSEVALAHVHHAASPEVCHVCVSAGGAAFVGVKTALHKLSPRLSGPDTDALRSWCDRLRHNDTVPAGELPTIRLSLSDAAESAFAELTPTAAWSETVEQFAATPGHRPVLEVRRFVSLITAAPAPAHPPTATGVVELIAVEDADVRVLVGHCRDVLAPPTLGSPKDNPATLVHHIAGPQVDAQDGCVHSADHVLAYGKRLAFLGEEHRAGDASLYGAPSSLEVVATFEDGYSIGLRIRDTEAGHIVEGCHRHVHGAPGVSKLRWSGFSEVPKTTPEVGVLAKLAKAAGENAPAGPVTIPTCNRKLLFCDVTRTYRSAAGAQHGQIERVARIARASNDKRFQLRWAERFVVPTSLAQAYCDLPPAMDTSLDAEVAAMAHEAVARGPTAAAAERFVTGDAVRSAMAPTWASTLDENARIPAPWAKSLVQLQLPTPMLIGSDASKLAARCTTGVLVRAPADGCVDIDAEAQPWVRRGDPVVIAPFSPRVFRELLGSPPAAAATMSVAEWSAPVRFASPVLGPEAAFEARGFVPDDANIDETFNRDVTVFRIIRPPLASTEDSLWDAVSRMSFHTVPLPNFADRDLRHTITITGAIATDPAQAAAGMPLFLRSGHLEGFGQGQRRTVLSWQHLMSSQLRAIGRRWRLLGR